jgi:hypothetical protein
LRDDIRERNQYHRCISFLETLPMLEHISRAFIGPSLLALALGGTLGTAAAGEVGQSAAALEAGVNPLVRPGDDFFAYANGSWLQATSLPPGKKSWTARNEINERVSQQMQACSTMYGLIHKAQPRARSPIFAQPISMTVQLRLMACVPSSPASMI